MKYRLITSFLLICQPIMVAVRAVEFTVNTTLDQLDSNPGDGMCITLKQLCSLRAAIQESNVLSGYDVVQLPSGVYTLSVLGQDEDQAQTGDLDILDDLIIIGKNRQTTIIDGDRIDRIFDILADTNIQLDLSGLTIQKGKAHGNIINGIGGAIRLLKTTQLKLNQVHFKNNQAERGGAIYNEGKVQGQQVLFTENTGSAVANEGAQAELILQKCLFESNQAAIESTNFDFVTKTRILVSLDQCSIVNNSSNHGSIIFNNARTDFTLLNSTLSGNGSNQTDGVLFNDNSSRFFIRNSTITDNQAGGIFEFHHKDSFIFMQNSILANNHGHPTIGINCSLKLTSQGGNYFGDLTGCEPTLHPSDIVASDDVGLTDLIKLQQPWQQLHLPLKNSPILDAALTITCLAVDQLDSTRPQDNDFDGVATCTIGASEISDVIFLNAF